MDYDFSVKDDFETFEYNAVETSLYYNKFIKFPFLHSAEILYREDNIYNIICIINYNTNRVIKERGSAIFLHIANTDYSGTAGCLALKQDDLIELLQNMNMDTKINVLD